MKEEFFHGESAVRITFGKYCATLLPEKGGNLISFIDTEQQYHFLREPKAEEMDSFRSAPFAYGIPVLFPPNRYEDGAFSINGRNYQLPINEEAHRNHLHGFFYDMSWEVTEVGSEPSESFVVIRQHVGKDHSAYRYFPHEFTLSIRYSLSQEGLKQEVEIINQDSISLPCLLGFHTAINAPFSAHSTMDDIQLVMTIGERWELNDRMLPTGQLQPLSNQEQQLKTDGISPFYSLLDNHYTAIPQNGKNFAALTDTKEKVRLVYEVSPEYRHWMIWNQDAASGFFCPEPQTNIVNAPNVSLPRESTGILLLEPGETWKAISRMYVEKL